MSDNDSLNLYGDRVVATTDLHVADIATQRMDDLDRKCLEYALRSDTGSLFAVDIGCGLGMQGIRLAVLGVETLLVDTLDISETVAAVSRLSGEGRLSLLVRDARELSRNDLPKPPDIVFSQRYIHYLDFRQAGALLSVLSGSMRAGARLFVSASGLDSELGRGYRDKKLPIERRYCELDPDIAEKHHIGTPVCLYREQDIRALAGPFDFAPLEIWTSPFGNVKAVFEKRA